MNTESAQPFVVPPGWFCSQEMSNRLGVAPAMWRGWLDVVAREGRDWLRDTSVPRRSGRPSEEYRNALFYRPECEAVFAALLRKELDAGQAILALSGQGPMPQPIPVQLADPVMEEELTVISKPRLWPDGNCRHFPNPCAVRARRANGEEVTVRVARSACFTPFLRGTSEPMKLRARYAGDPKIWSLVGPLPRGIGIW